LHGLEVVHWFGVVFQPFDYVLNVCLGYVSCSRASLALTRRLRALSTVLVSCVCCRVHVGAFFVS
jgi:uncharacterized membrane protein YjdF